MTKSNIKELLSQINIVEYISNYISLKKKGNNFFGKCPFHIDATPSFSVCERKGFFYCFGCKINGDIIDFDMRIENTDFITSINKLFNLYNCGKTSFNKSVNKTNLNLYKDKIFHNINEYKLNNILLYYFKKYLLKKNSAITFLNKRKLNLFTMKLFSIGYCDKDILLKSSLLNNESDFLYLINQIFFFKNRIIFPIRNINGYVCGFGGREFYSSNVKYLNSKESCFFKKNQNLYGLYEIKKINHLVKRIIVVEGYFDVLSIFNINLCASAILGTNISEYQIKLLMSHTKTIIFCYDSDEAGFIAIYNTIILISKYIHLKYEFKFIILPLGYDPDSFICQYGKKDFIKLINRSFSYDLMILKYLFDFYLLKNRIKEYILLIRIILKLIKNNNIRKLYYEIITYNFKKKIFFSDNLSKKNKFIIALIIFIIKNPNYFINIKINLIFNKINNLCFTKYFFKIFNFIKFTKGILYNFNFIKNKFYLLQIKKCFFLFNHFQLSNCNIKDFLYF